MSAWVDFRALKDTASLEWILQRYGVKLNRLQRVYLRGRCPLPTHRSLRSAESFCVHTGKQVWVCHSRSCQQARQGRAGGTILDLVAAMESCTLREAGLRIQGWLGSPATKGKTLGTGAALEAAEGNWLQTEDGDTGHRLNRVLPFQLRLSSEHPYWQERGVRPETARAFGAGFYPGRGFLGGRVVFPIHNEHGALVAYAGRSVDGSPPKYKFPAGFRKSLVLFNLHRATAVAGCRTVVVVEGFFDCLKVHQAGFPNVVALLGVALTDHQAGLLREHFHRVVLMLDGDQAGRRATQAVAARLSALVDVAVAPVPAAQQPDQMSTLQIQQILETDVALSPVPPAGGQLRPGSRRKNNYDIGGNDPA